MGWNDALKPVIKRKEDAQKQRVGARDEAAKEKCMEAYREEKIKDKKVYTYITTKRRQMKVQQEDESRSKWKQEAILEGSEEDE